ncbi:MAG: hypothetical protein P1T08_12280 [Acidimicrobiia bacterium]|nr:hypothetical protein [Acidimicrobiia bacterium]
MKHASAKEPHKAKPVRVSDIGSRWRFTTGMVLVLALVLTLAAVAAAAPPDFCNPESPDYRPDHPSCSSTTTTAPQPSEVQACTTDVLSGINGSGATRFECLWTPAPSETEIGTVTVTPLGGAISNLVVFVRDASPGDICVLKQEWADQTGASYTATFDLAYGYLPRDADWDPDDIYPDYAPYENETYWSLGGQHWCYPQDPIKGMRADPNGKPLHLQVNFRIKKGTMVDIVLDPPQVMSPPTSP